MDRKETYAERGYLREEYRIFHLSGVPESEVPFHYHDFMKILLLVKGNIGYIIEGRQYELLPGDIVIVRAGEIHRPVVREQEAYERIVLYLSKEFLKELEGTCFDKSVFRSTDSDSEEARRILRSATDGVCAGYQASHLLQRSRLTEFLILLSSAMGRNQSEDIHPVSQNDNVRKVLSCINSRLTEDISIGDIVEEVHLTRSYLMHMFKAETGYTIKEYITEKRLFLADTLLAAGVSMTDACYRSGFTNYTSFYRSYTRKYGSSPRVRRSRSMHGMEIID